MSRPTQEAVEDNVLTWQVAIYELHREIDKLDQELEILRGQSEEWRQDFIRNKKRANDLEARIKCGRHAWSCDRESGGKKCTCGFEPNADPP